MEQFNTNTTFYELKDLKFICKDTKGHYLFQYNKELPKDDQYLITKMNDKMKKHTFFFSSQHRATNNKI